MNFDDSAPVPVADYRRFQTIVPGIEGLYEVLLALCEQRLADFDPILVSGAGGGRELEALAASRRNYQITGVDPSRAMLDVAWEHLPVSAHDRVELVQGRVEDLPSAAAFAAATSILVMHFLTDDGMKRNYLQAIRSRLRPGASYIHADVSIASMAELQSFGPVITHRGISLDFPEAVSSMPEDAARNGFASEPPMIVGPTRIEELMAEAGFKVLGMPHRCMWFTTWLAEAI